MGEEDHRGVGEEQVEPPEGEGEEGQPLGEEGPPV